MTFTNWQKYQIYSNWVKKNYFTLFGIIIILCIVWYDVATVQSKIKKEVDNCNAYYEDALEKVCPHVLGKYENTMVNTTNFFMMHVLNASTS